MGFLGVLAHSLVPGAWAAEPAAPAVAVERLHAALLTNMKSGKQATFETRRQRLEPVVKESFDLAGMARLSTGAAWAKMSEGDRAQIVTTFTDWTIASYAANFREWNGEAFTTKHNKNDGKGNVVVGTEMSVKNSPPVAFDYRMREKDGAWRIIDIYLDGAISQLALYRSQFSAALGSGGVDGLLGHMRTLTAEAQKKGS